VGRILICEPDPEVRELLRHVVERHGHEPVFEPNGTSIAAVVVEPADVLSVEVAQTARAGDPGLPIVCASIEPPTPSSRSLGPVAHVVKPFTLSEFDSALATALGRNGH
jgi:CheY-like chemotaxis protein